MSTSIVRTPNEAWIRHSLTAIESDYSRASAQGWMRSSLATIEA